MLIIVASLTLGGCASTKSTNVVVAPPKLVLVAPDSKLTAPCLSPIKLPERELKQSEVEDFWGTDRKNLADCRDLKDTLNNFYVTRDAELQK